MAKSKGRRPPFIVEQRISNPREIVDCLEVKHSLDLFHHQALGKVTLVKIVWRETESISNKIVSVLASSVNNNQPVSPQIRPPISGLV